MFLFSNGNKTPFRGYHLRLVAHVAKKTVLLQRLFMALITLQKNKIGTKSSVTISVLICIEPEEVSLQCFRCTQASIIILITMMVLYKSLFDVNLFILLLCKLLAKINLAS